MKEWAFVLKLTLIRGGVQKRVSRHVRVLCVNAVDPFNHREGCGNITLGSVFVMRCIVENDKITICHSCTFPTG